MQATERTDAHVGDPTTPQDPYEVFLSFLSLRKYHPNSGIRVGIVKFPGGIDRSGSRYPVIIDISEMNTDVPTIEARADEVSALFEGNSLDLLREIGEPDFIIDEDPRSYAQRLIEEMATARLAYRDAKRDGDMAQTLRCTDERFSLARELLAARINDPASFDFLRIGTLERSNDSKIEFSMLLPQGGFASSTVPLSNFRSYDIIDKVQLSGGFDYAVPASESILR